MTLRAFAVLLVLASYSCTRESPSSREAHFGDLRPKDPPEAMVLRKRDHPENRIPLQLPLVQPRIAVRKGERTLTLHSGGKVVRTYPIGLGASPIEDKERRGDMRTPEGSFYVFVKNDKSKYYLSLGLSYPNAEDAKRGLRDGIITLDQHDAIRRAIRRKIEPPQDTPLGGDIFIHGRGSQTDWTWGCVALDDKDMRELFDAVKEGMEVVIEH